ncbi:MAG: ABC transporter ATP-binding protein [Gammaproteobacteria bacterium]|nr:ABC transporter ATP-binding protein [Gammaproteobacteria bacterium]MYE53511.1 ABC transporter ATP-binding protein [Gammaproteobacteria bacterium]
MTLVQAQGLSKRFGDVQALDGFDLTVEPGQIVGLIGPNGSGKTTALKAILGLSRLDGGHIQAFGLDPFKQRPDLMRRTAYIADTGILPRWMRIRDLLAFVASVNPAFDRNTAEAALANTEIRPEKKVGTLSKGMTVQLHLAIVLAVNAELLVLDEPTLGLDILYRQRFYDALLNDYFAEQRAILVTTHEVREIEHILTQVVFIDRGRTRLHLGTEELAASFAKVVANAERSDALRAMNPLSERRSLRGREFIFRDANAQALAECGEVSTPSLPELFTAVMEERR